MVLLQRGLEERSQLRDSLVHILGHVVQIHMVGAVDDVKLLVLAGGAGDQVVAHPLAARVAAGHGQDGLGQESLCLVVGVIGDDLREVAQQCMAGSRA